MKWLIIIFIVMSLIGSVMWVMPTPRQRFQAQLRLRAKPLGLHVQLANLQLPRQRGEVEGETLSVPVYRMQRLNLNRDEKANWKGWQLFRGETLANEGLTEGWSWIKGERTLSDAAMSLLNQVLSQMPSDVIALESTPTHASAFWQEGEDEDLERIAEQLKTLIEQRV
ncbi:hypothetical protein GCM10011352_15250 [Marinobacterium zhoushanense]|uniref:Preprotein translocase subunit YajC n=1 Tax=Marinobacterium zhoushanense TaxID=1679163 RepID=A0ABQ1KAZ5_9GAMM|nr:hypothetical protein [Marinobacterium zhoushanense]GGB90175.1 hypothetical protein GCM10011352_15250 [Marinobacterium zhoushanense]